MIKIINIIKGDIDFIENLRGKKASFLLAVSNSRTANIKGISQAGILDKIYLTPTLDSEFISTGEVRSLDIIAETQTGIPTPALITRAVHILSPFGRIEILDLGLDIQPKIKYFQVHNFDIKPSESIAKKIEGANINANLIFEKGLEFGRSYECKDDYIILGESVPSGTTTAMATALGLGYGAENCFSSSFKDVPTTIKDATLKLALDNIKYIDNKDIFNILGKVGDNMLIFNAGFILGINNRTPIVLAGGTQMASVLLVVNSILKLMGGEMDTSNLALCTTKWVAEDKNSDINTLIELLDFPINGYYANFDFSFSDNSALQSYDYGEAKEGVGAGGALMYGLINGLTKEDITKSVESFL
ncbi:MAG: TIGR00303 family protein, partial [Sulfurovum sp.]|nr:TIGR00303 family protein [Sulfurovaceae bacterium]